jgi:hypothetical protein
VKLVESFTAAAPSGCCAARRIGSGSTGGNPTKHIVVRVQGPHKQPRPNDSSDALSKGVIAFRALACHGFGTEWLAALVVTSPMAASWSFASPPCGDVSLSAALTVSSLADAPPVPPPRAANA